MRFAHDRKQTLFSIMGRKHWPEPVRSAWHVNRNRQERLMKSLFWLLVKAAIFFLLFALALNNRHEVPLHFLLGHSTTLPMMVVVLGAMVFGIFLGIAATVPHWWRLRKALKQAQKQLADHTAAQAEQPSSSAAADSAAHTPSHVAHAPTHIPHEI